MDKIAFRQMDGTIKIQNTVPDQLGNYDGFKIYRKEILYPTNLNGYLLTSGSLNVGDETIVDHHDQLNIKEGTVYYYALYLTKITPATEIMWRRDWCMGLEPDFTKPLKAIVDSFFSNNLAITSNTNVRLFIDGMMKPIAGEMEALVRCMPKMLDLQKTDPKIFMHILKAFNWKMAPLLNLKENKEVAEQLISYYYPNKGQREVLETLYELENLTPVRIWEWHKNVYEQFIGQDGQENYVETIIGSGSGIININIGFDCLPYTFSIRYYDAGGNIVTITDTPSTIISGILYEGHTPVGTITYSGTQISLSAVPTRTAPGLNQQIWAEYKYDITSVDFEDDVTITRRGYHGDRILYAVAPTRSGDYSGLGAWIYFYLHMEMGKEVYFSDATTHSYTFEDGEEETYEATYMTNLKFKSDRIQPVFGQQVFVFVDRIVAVVDVNDYIGNLPLEKQHLGMW